MTDVLQDCAERLAGEATVLEDAGRVDEAVELLVLSLQVAETSKAHWYLGKLRLKRGEFAAAIHSLQRALELFPTHGPTRFELAKAYVGQGDLAAALGQLGHILASSPTHPSAQTLKFEILARSGQTHEAIAYFESTPGLAVACSNRLIYFSLLVRTGQKREDEFAELGLKVSDLRNRPTWL